MSLAKEMSHLELSPEQLYRRLDPERFPFQTAREASEWTTTIGQPRAIESIEFALESRAGGYNLFVTGQPGSGRESAVRDLVQNFAATRPTPPDWIYVHNFAEPDRPNAISLPAGMGSRFAHDMEQFIQAAQREIPRAFESEDYERRQRDALAELTEQRNALLGNLQSFAQERGFVVEMTPAGIATMPVLHGRPISPQEYPQLPPEARQEIEARGKEVAERIAATLREVRQIEKQVADRVHDLERDVVLFTTGPFFDELRERYADQREIPPYLEQVRQDLIEHLREFLQAVHAGAQAQPGMANIQEMQRHELLSKYEVNVVIDNRHTQGAPVVIERNPTYYNLIGRLDYRSMFGAMVTDFQQIKNGALHRANGGVLLLHANELLRHPFSWDALKRSLICREVQIENLGEQYSAVPTASLRPEAIPINLKVVLIGTPIVYRLLYHLDEDFQDLFKVKAEFAPDMDWTDEHIDDYVGFISKQIHDAELRDFDRGAVARIIEHGARLRDHQRKLSTRFLDIVGVMAESDFWAGKAGHDVVQAEDVDLAIRKQEYRANLLEERIQELMVDGTIMIDTEGERVAQVNGLSVTDLGDYVFGIPSRISARVALGNGNIVSIEREIELSGPIHSKGFYILSGYLAGMYAQESPLSLGATITFEQSYSEIDGDSASSTELYALLSALSGVPLKQGIAVTGSVNQQGEVQAVGGVSRKIEGFFAVCKAKGLTGEQGVMIPAANVQNLMLQDDVIEAVREGQFHVWAIRTIDEGIELLTGQRAGTRGSDGQFPEGTIHRRVEDRLRHYADQVRSYRMNHDGSGHSSALDSGGHAPGHE